VYVTGTTGASNFPTKNAYQSSYQGGSQPPGDAFVSKLQLNGNGANDLVYSTYLGGGGYDEGNGIAVNANGEAYVAGNGGPPAVAPLPNGGVGATFVTKFDANGQSVIYSTAMPGASFIKGLALGFGIGDLGNAYITGTAQAGLQTTAGVFQPNNAGVNDAFVAKISDLSPPPTPTSTTTPTATDTPTATPTPSQTPTNTPEDSGFVPPDKNTAKCADTVAVHLKKLGACITTCQIKQADAALKGVPFDEEACEHGTGKPMSCRAAYDKATAALLGLKKPICPACLDAAAQGNLADLVTNFLENRNGQVYCAGTSSFGDDDPGFIPPAKNAAKCEDTVAKHLKKLAGCITKCQVKQADFALKGTPFDEEACEAGTGKPVSCRAAYDKATAALLGRTTPICPPCLDATAQRGLADSVTTFLDQANGQIDCAGTKPLATHVVSVAPNGMLTFSPQNLTINTGETVQWVWSSGGHSVVSGSSCAADGQFCSPSDTSCGTAPTSAQGATYSHTFSTPGTYPYFCNVHCGGFGMVGTITVQ
jgi:plastocyanin